MSSITASVPEVKPTIGPIKSECGESDPVRLGANPEQEDSEPPTPKTPTRALSKPIKEEDDDDDDPLSYLTTLFSHATLYDDFDSSEDESVPDSPRPKGHDRYCFYASSRLYYFDEYHNVYSEDNTRISNGSLNLQLDDLLTPNFHIDGVPYWFDLDGLLYQNIDGTMNRVHVWHSDPEPFNLGPVFDPSTFQPMFLPTFQNDMTSFVPEATPELSYGSSPSPPATQISDFNSPLTKNEVLSPSNTQSLRRAFQGSDLPWSPSSSTKSPIVATASRESSVEASLFPDTQYGHFAAAPIAAKRLPKSPIVATQSYNLPEEAPLFPDAQLDLVSGIQAVAKWHQETAKAQKDAETARPVKKPSKDERRRCPICGKMFRRPSSLEDHLNVHSGDKPHMCVFKGCNVGFATKSNMKRHFLTHRVGPLEHYRPGLVSSEIPRVTMTKTGKAPRAPTSTYNSRAHHTLRFRVA
ncbi:hypothetical protein RSOLAG22IIIB_14098 [Rhizoctonia solani]|uniref:C2H2-type domain-containing protein n=1 Tax=Rhizoctonia solani TaxID=456999 RepID=A0A0K6FTY0_9AGAM|nr:unnamed protein product [Rhizoctonia solani]CUA69711.1 hypothetical protein RSOLAG22IIIB_14098 [Rhizoctonia solani]